MTGFWPDLRYFGRIYIMPVQQIFLKYAFPSLAVAVAL